MKGNTENCLVLLVSKVESWLTSWSMPFVSKLMSDKANQDVFLHLMNQQTGWAIQANAEKDALAGGRSDFCLWSRKHNMLYNNVPQLFKALLSEKNKKTKSWEDQPSLFCYMIKEMKNMQEKTNSLSPIIKQHREHKKSRCELQASPTPWVTARWLGHPLSTHPLSTNILCCYCILC